MKTKKFYYILWVCVHKDNGINQSPSFPADNRPLPDLPPFTFSKRVPPKISEKKRDVLGRDPHYPLLNCRTKERRDPIS